MSFIPKSAFTCGCVAGLTRIALYWSIERGSPPAPIHMTGAFIACAAGGTSSLMSPTPCPRPRSAPTTDHADWRNASPAVQNQNLGGLFVLTGMPLRRNSSASSRACGRSQSCRRRAPIRGWRSRMAPVSAVAVVALVPSAGFPVHALAALLRWQIRDRPGSLFGSMMSVATAKKRGGPTLAPPMVDVIRYSTAHQRGSPSLNMKISAPLAARLHCARRSIEEAARRSALRSGYISRQSDRLEASR
jgi:hypothetical protein